MGDLIAKLFYTFSSQHLESAQYFAEKAGEMEQQESVDRSQHRANVTAAVLTSVAFLEALVNEAYFKIIQTKLPPSLAESQRQLIQQLWDQTVEGVSTLKKYQVLLLMLGATPFDAGGHPYQDTQSLIKLRNCLIHYSPEFHDEAQEHEALKRRLQGKFAENPLAPHTHLWFPHQCLGAGCARWSIDTARVFAEAFTARTPPHPGPH